jgi:uncharacterized membrane protein
MSAAQPHSISLARLVTITSALAVLLAEMLLPPQHPLATGGLIALVGALVFNAFRSGGATIGLGQLLSSALAGVLLATAIHLVAWDTWIAALMPALVQSLLALLVARTLRPGKTPFIHRIGAAMQPDGQPLPPEVADYARRSTWLWLCLFCVLALLNLIAVLPEWPDPKAPVALGLLDTAIAGAVVLLEYFYRRWRFAAHNKHTLLEFCRGLRRLDPLDILLS